MGAHQARFLQVKKVEREMARHAAEQQVPAGPQRPCQVVERLLGVGKVLEHVPADDGVERAGLQRIRLDVADDLLVDPGIQGERVSIDVDPGDVRAGKVDVDPFPAATGVQNARLAPPA